MRRVEHEGGRDDGVPKGIRVAAMDLAEALEDQVVRPIPDWPAVLASARELARVAEQALTWLDERR